MRPEKLFALFSDISKLRGVGDNTRKALMRLFGKTNVFIRDLAFHLPVSVVDRRNSPPLKSVKNGDIITMVMKIEDYHVPDNRRGGKKPHKIICYTPDGYITLTFFKAHPDYLRKELPIGESRAISGKVEKYGEIIQISHPDIIAPAEDIEKIKTLETVYGLTYGISNRYLTKIINDALAHLPDLPEWIDSEYLKQQGWNSWKNSLLAAHKLVTPDDLLPESKIRRRLAYDEILANQLALALVRKRLKKKLAEPISEHNKLREKLRENLPYKLTAGQEQTIAEIDVDLASCNRMLRLLQGDVGSGKTIVAIMAMLRVIESGRQAAFMIPTELLGKQHFAFLEKYAEALEIKIALLTGGMKLKEYNAITEKIASGEINLVIGTHALFQDKVIFKNLGLAVIDEQHRFGVSQRLALTRKSDEVHVLVMTATPIPRTLTMTAFGDMDCSILAEKPAGRSAIVTKAVPISRAEEVLQGLARSIAKEEKIYWICPLVEESEDTENISDLAAVEARYIEFKHRSNGRVGMAHGKMSSSERDQAMSGFAGSEFDILVATTVVEVGVDVPDATIIVIEHAERFGLAQLHQLRGRVGRGNKQSVCILLYNENCSEIAKSRLKIIRETNDGFLIAEEDLRLRGSGDILGTRQSGLQDFQFADLTEHYNLMQVASNDVKYILGQDAELKTPRGEALRVLLYLFGYDENIRFISAG